MSKPKRKEKMSNRLQNLIKEFMKNNPNASNEDLMAHLGGKDELAGAGPSNNPVADWPGTNMKLQGGGIVQNPRYYESQASGAKNVVTRELEMLYRLGNALADNLRTLDILQPERWCEIVAKIDAGTLTEEQVHKKAIESSTDFVFKFFGVRR